MCFRWVEVERAEKEVRCVPRVGLLRRVHLYEGEAHKQEPPKLLAVRGFVVEEKEKSLFERGGERIEFAAKQEVLEEERGLCNLHRKAG